ncbi:MAG: response regulator [Thermodesulfovibrionales bacterium]
MRILVVDDTEENRRYLGALLKGQAHEVVFAVNGEEALEKLSPGGIDLIISDILMPVMDGYRFCRECKQDPRLKEIPFIFITSSYTEEKDEEFALSLGAERFLRRPVEALAMVSTINEVLSGRREEKGGSRHREMQEESRYLSEYSNRVVKKLEDKVRELEAAISERRRIERAFRALSECNQALLRASDERGLLQEICRIMVETGGYCFAWTGFAEQDRERTVSAVAQCGHGEGFLENAGITWADTERGRGPTGTAIRTGMPQVNQDLLSDPRMAPWRDAALQNGFAACISLPLKDEGGAFAALTIYSCEPYAFNSEEVALLTGLADDLSFSIASLRAKAESDFL